MSRATQAIVRRERWIAGGLAVAVAAVAAIAAGWVTLPSRTAPAGSLAAPDFSAILATRAAQLQPVSPWWVELKPTNVRAGRGSVALAVSVTWSPPADLHGLHIDQYLVQIYDMDGPQPHYEGKLVASCPPCTSVDFPSLPPSHSFEFAVWPHVVSGYGQAAGSDRYTTPALPGPPRAVTAGAGAGAGSVSVRWEPPLSDGGAAVQGYIVQAFDVDTVPVFVTSLQTGCGSCTAVTFTSLSPGRHFAFAVYARSGAGVGVPSASPAVTAPPVTAPPVTAPPG